MRMDNGHRWGPLDSPEPVVLDLKSTVAAVRARAARRPSTSSSAAASSITSLSASSASSSRPALDVSRPGPAASLVVCTAPADTLGAFAPTTPVADTLRALLPPRTHPLRRFVPALFVAAPPPAPAGPAPDAFVIPAICRTASSGPLEQPFAVPAAPAPSPHRKQDWTPIIRRAPKHRVAAAAAPAPAPTPAPAADAPRLHHGGLDPRLAAAEDASRLRTTCVCTTCGARGDNFPRCPRSGAAWCSRECRIAAKAAAMRAPRPERPRIAIPV